jgi:hypothetical protein
MASYEMGNYVPALADRRCVLGHYGLTIDAAGKQNEVGLFYTTGAVDDAWRRQLAARYGVTHVLWTAHERALGAWLPSDVSWLRETFRAGAGDSLAVVYEIIAR